MRFSLRRAHDYHGLLREGDSFSQLDALSALQRSEQRDVRSSKLDEALAWSGILGKWFEATRLEGMRVMGPAAAPIVRLKTEYRYHFLLKSASRERMNTVLRAMIEHADRAENPTDNLVVDVDALSLT